MLRLDVTIGIQKERIEMDFDPEILEQELLYSDDVLLYFRSKLDEGILKCFHMIAEASGPFGLLRTKIPDFNKNRRQYDMGFTILEAQGFIYAEEFGNTRPYFLTIRGKQLQELLKKEEKKLKTE